MLLVQALFVTSLLFALPISAKLGHRQVTRWEWTWAVLLAAAWPSSSPSAIRPRAIRGPRWETWTAVVAVLGPALVLCLLGARFWSGPVRAVLLGMVSGSLWGVFAVLTKGVVDRLDDGIWACAAHARAVRVGAGRHRGHGVAAVVVPGRVR